MAYDANWVQWCGYLDIVAARQDYRGEKARDLKLVLAKVMELEFEMNPPDTRALYDIVSNPSVVAAVVASLTHDADDEAALVAAVTAVVVPQNLGTGA